MPKILSDSSGDDMIKPSFCRNKSLPDPSTSLPYGPNEHDQYGQGDCDCRKIPPGGGNNQSGIPILICLGIEEDSAEDSL